MAAPKGNHNALKHGIYTKFFALTESKEISKMAKNRNEAEIDLCRLKLCHLIEEMVDEQDKEIRARQYFAISTLVGTISRMTQANMIYGKGTDSVLTSIYEAIRAANKGQHVK